MSRSSVAFVVMLVGVASLSQTIAAQSAPVGRLPLLRPVAAGATCADMPLTAELRSSGVGRLIQVDEPGRPRLLTLATTATKKPLILMVMMSTREERRSEGESVSVFFGADGTVRSGNRTAYTAGIPARASEDKKLGLLATDSVRAQTLSRGLLRLCRAEQPGR